MKRTIAGNLVLCALLSTLAATAAPAKWAPVSGPLMTRWGRDVKSESPLPEYPRPQMVRENWQSLNGLWDFSLTPKSTTPPAAYDQQILVPFPVESALSGVGKNVTEKDQLWYRRSFEVPKKWKGQRVLLHFGAVDFEAVIWLNGQEVGRHRGGYAPFWLDITTALSKRDVNELVVSVWDPTDAGPFPRGKQLRTPDKRCFYTGCSGIWQSVWLEPVPAVSMAGLFLTPDLDKKRVRVNVIGLNDAGGETVEAVAMLEGQEVGRASGRLGQPFWMPLSEGRAWAPETPVLYDLKLQLRSEQRVVDEVASYFALRKIAVGKDEKGTLRLLLNNKPVFQCGPLDQGYWPDGLYTAPTDEALRFDLEMTKKLGFNMTRKHVKIEPDRWYYWADKLGLLVWQDMPSGDQAIANKAPDLKRSPESARQFEMDLRFMIESLYNHPSIIQWVLFNEGWGQYDTARLTQWVKSLDPSRLVNAASGWVDRNVGDLKDVHLYPGPMAPAPDAKRASVLGEFGGVGHTVKGHLWSEETWGYKGAESVEKLTLDYLRLWKGVYGLKDTAGLAAAVYTQLTDVEWEGNGLLTYDREVVKMDLKTMADAARGVFPKMPEPVEVVLTSKAEPQRWRYTLVKPGDDWVQRGFRDAGWSSGEAGFGGGDLSNEKPVTEWKTADIWLRREFVLSDEKPSELFLIMRHDEDAEVYLNGVLAVRASGFLNTYETFNLSAESVQALKPGLNVMAIHCRNRSGGQFIDAGLGLYETK